jgi:hypothetical protein
MHLLEWQCVIPKACVALVDFLKDIPGEATFNYKHGMMIQLLTT